MSNGTPKNLFKIVEQLQRGDFNTEASDLIMKGFQPIGGITVYKKDSDTKQYYLQSFWRPDVQAYSSP